MAAIALLDRIFEPLGEALTPESAQRIVSLQADADVQERVEELADRCTEGLLTPEEAEEYDSYLRAIEFVSIMQSKARQVLLRANGGA